MLERQDGMISRTWVTSGDMEVEIYSSIPPLEFKITCRMFLDKGFLKLYSPECGNFGNVEYQAVRLIIIIIYICSN